MAVETEKLPLDLEKYRQFVILGRPGPHAYTVLLGMQTFDTKELLNIVSKGLRMEACEHLQRNFDLETRTMAQLLQTPSRTFARRKQEGALLPRESDRLLTVTRVLARALDLFEGDRDAALRWLKVAQPSLVDQTPIEALSTEIGTVEVERLIDRLEQGVYA